MEENCLGVHKDWRRLLDGNGDGEGQDTMDSKVHFKFNNGVENIKPSKKQNSGWQNIFYLLS